MSLLDRDRSTLWHPYTQHMNEPVELDVVSAKGSTLELGDGREILDAISSWWATLHGHGHPELVRAAAEQAKRLDHVLFAGVTHEPAVALAEGLLGVAPQGLQRVFYSDNGSTAVEVALKMALQAWVHRGEPQRRVFIGLEGSYHGDTFGAMAVGDPDPFFLPFQPLLFEARRVAPNREALTSALEELGERAAGVLLEPRVQGACGMRMHPAEFLRDARRLCDEAGLPLIADEVMTGFGRTGALFACDTAGISPDLMCLGKGLTGGMLPLSATLATESIFETFLSNERSRAFFHGHTFTANPIGCAVAVASLAVSLGNDVAAQLEAVGSRIEQGLASDLDRERYLLRRTGGIVALDLPTPDGEAKGYLASLAPRLRSEAVRRGVLLRPLGNVLYALPPACTSEDECDRIAEVMLELVALAQ